MVLLLSLLTSAAAVMAVPLTAETRDSQPNPKDIYIENGSYGGSGCPGGSVGFALSSDATSFTLSFDRFKASTSSIDNYRKACTISLNLNIPMGFAYTITTIDTRGHVYLEDGVSAIQKNAFYFSGSATELYGQTNFTGPVNKDFVLSDEFAIVSLVYSPCNASALLNIVSQVALTKPQNYTGQGYIEEDSIDGKFVVEFQLQYQKCTTT